jgi:hypothetical protein
MEQPKMFWKKNRLHAIQVVKKKKRNDFIEK